MLLWPKNLTVVRVDLYANDTNIYFSELTFTSNQCEGYYRPIAADGLLYDLMHGIVTPEQATPDYVERIINGD